MHSCFALAIKTDIWELCLGDKMSNIEWIITFIQCRICLWWNIMVHWNSVPIADPWVNTLPPDPLPILQHHDTKKKKKKKLKVVTIVFRSVDGSGLIPQTNMSQGLIFPILQICASWYVIMCDYNGRYWLHNDLYCVITKPIMIKQQYTYNCIITKSIVMA